jgi:hypothetical protein
MSIRKKHSHTNRQVQRRKSAGSKRMQRKKVSLGASVKHAGHRAPRPSSLSATQLEIRAGVFAAHADMLRNPKLAAAQAAKGNGIGIRDLWMYAPKAFKKNARGRIRAVQDRYVRRIEVPGPDGPAVIKIKGSKAARQIARFRNDVFSFLAGNASALEKWKGVKIQGHELLTDPQIIRLLGQQDNLPEHFGSEQVIPYAGGGAR